MGTAGSTPDHTHVSITAQPTGNIDIASAVRQWWRRVASISRSRYFDPRLCGLKQPGTVWLLGGGTPQQMGGVAPQGTPERFCKVRANLPILAPVANEFEVVTDVPPRIPTLSPNQVNVMLDGKPLTPVWVANSRPYKIMSAVPGNSLELHAGTRLVDGGYWVLIDPGLAPGRHHLNIRNFDTPNRLWTLVAS
jgi:hypothetical protein